MTILEQILEFHKRYGHWDVPTEILLGITPRIEHGRVKRAISRGKWSVLVFSSDPAKTAMYGLKILPWLPGSQWPTVDIMPYMQSTIEFPSITKHIAGIHWRFLNNRRSACEKYNENWAERYEAMMPVYRLFGGTDDLDDLKSLVLDRDLWPVATISEEELLQRQRAHSLKIEPSAANHYLWDLLDKVQDDDFIPDLPAIDMGIWSDRIKSIIASRASMHAFDVPFQTIEKQLLQAVAFTHGFDTENIRPSYTPSGAETSNFIFSRIEDLCAPYNTRSPEVENSIEYYIASTMNEKQGAYNGTAHLEAAALFAEKGEAQKAWTALASAGYWAGKNMPEAQETILKAAIYLCEKHQWDEAADALRHNLDFLQNDAK